MSLFDRFKKKAEEVAGGVWRQVNPLDGGKTYSNPTGQPRPVQQPAAQAPRPQPNRTNQVQQMLGSTRTNAFANNIKPVTPTPIQTPNLRVNMPSYGSGLNGAFNKFKDNFDANTPQDQFKRNQQVQAPLRPNMNYQQQQQVAPSNLTKAVNLANSAKNNAITPMATASKIAVGQITGNQQARNNALDTYKQGVKGNLNALNSFKEGIIGSSKQIGTGLAYQSKDFQNAQKAQTNLVDIQNQQKLNAIKRAKQGFNTQQDVDRFMNYANNLWQNEAESRQAQIDIQKEQQKQLDPTRNALAIADAGLTALSFGVAGPTKNLSQAAGRTAFENAIKGGATKEVATQIAKKASMNEIIRQSALTGSMGGFQGAINPYITKDPGTITPMDVITGAVSGGVMGGVLPGAFVGASSLKKPVQNALNRLNIDNQIGAVGKNVKDNLDPLEALKAEARTKAQQTEALKKQGKIKPTDENYWSTPVEGQPKAPIPEVRDTNGVIVKEGDVIEAPGSLGGNARRTIQWSKPQIANASGEYQEGRWLGNGILEQDANRPFTIVERDGKPFTQPTPPVQKPKTATGGLDASTVATATTVKKQRPVVQQIPEESPYPLAKTQTTTPQGPPPTKFDDQMALGPGQTKKTRFADKTVPESEFVSEKIKGSIKTPEYNVQTEKQGYTSALSRLKKEGDAKFETQVFDNLDKKKGTISRQEAIDAQTLAAVLDGGDDASIRKATAIYEKLSEHYTAAGQLTQAAAILARRSPEGLRAYATTAFKNSGVKITPQLEQELTKLVQAVREASPEALPRAQWDVMNFVAKKTPTSFGDKVINTWRAGLLTAPTTTGGNILGNSGEALVRKGFVNPVATAADAVMGAFTGKRTMTLAKGGSATKGAAEGTGMLKEYLKSGYDPRVNNTKYDAPRSINTGIKALDTYINGTYRLMGVADMPFSTLAEKEALSSLAKAEAINKGLKGKARTDFVNEFMKNPPDTALARAQQEADYATFKNPTMLGKAATGMKRPLGAVGDFFVPFTQVPASIATRIVERTPIGTANNIVKQLIEVKKNGGQFDQRALSQSIGNGMFGPAVFGVGYALAGNDQLTFGYPKDNTERKLWDSEGKQPYSVKVGNRWYSLNYLQPFGTLLAIGGQARQAANEGKSIDEIIFQGGATAGQSVMNQSFLKGIGGALDAIGDPERSVNKYIEQTTSSVVPNFVRSYARAADDKQRQPIGLAEGVKSGIPGLRGSTTPKLDAFGKPLPAKDTFLNQYVNPLKPSIARTSPTVEELRRLKDANLSTMPTEGDTTTFGKNNKIDKKQLKDLNGAIGSRVGEAWDKIIASPEYKSMSDENKKKALDAAKKDYGAVAKAEWAAKNNKMNDMWQPNLTKKQQDIATGLSPDYLTVSKPKEKVVKSKYSQEVQDFAKLSNSEKNAYFRRDPVKAKQLYDQSKKMEAELGTKSKTSKATTKKASTKKTAKKSTKGRKIARGKMPKFISVTNGKRMNLMVSKVKYSPVQKPKMAKVKTTKTIAKKSKIA